MDFRQIKEIESANKKKLLKLFPALTEQSGIYILYRFEDGLKYAFVNRAKNILTELSDYLKECQEIQLSIKKHGWFSEGNKNGWIAASFKYPVNELNEREQFHIRECERAGYVVLNKKLTS